MCSVHAGAPMDGCSSISPCSSLAAAISSSEHPCILSARDGTILRLVAPNERLSETQLVLQLQHLLCQAHIQQLVNSLVVLSNSNRKLRLKRHVAAWLRGSCYLSAGNIKQALRDARAALAYAAAAAATPPAAAHQHSLQGSVTGWFPALLLAGQALAALGDHPQAVLHLAQAQAVAPPYMSPSVSAALQESVRGLSADQAYAWAASGLQGLQQQLQDEADLRLPEVLRPRPKWYYYNQWMKQRIHLALLELHLGANHTPATQPHLLGNDAHSTAPETSTSSARGRLLLGMLSDGGQEAPAVALSAAAAGFQGRATGPASALALTATPERVAGCTSSHADLVSLSQTDVRASNPGPSGRRSADINVTASTAAGVQDGSTVPVDAAERGNVATLQPPGQSGGSSSSACDQSGGSSALSNSSGSGLQLPGPVLDKLLSLDAGDLDLMVQHPVALQGQVYELLDVLQAQGPQGLQDYPVARLAWDEVQALAGPATVGLPLGYTPKAAALAPSAAAGAAALTAACSVDALSVTPSPASMEAGNTLAVARAVSMQGGNQGQMVGNLAGEISTAELVCQAGSGSVLTSERCGWHRPGWTRTQYVADAAAKLQQEDC